MTSEHICGGRTDGYGGYTCVECGVYYPLPHHQKPKPTDAELVEIMRDAVNRFYGSDEISRSALKAALSALREKGYL